MSDDIPLLFRHRSGALRKRELRRFFAGMTARVAPRRQIVCLITDDQELRRLNRNFRAANYPTDVLSFPSERGGEIAISVDRAREQAAEHGHSVDEEIRILMLHGALHLAGMDHETDHGAMRRAEIRWRKRLGLPRGLIERAHA
ncbi:MAG TPA: rRNA maturation RNase YbeY [Bryobacteraceae bacterium]|nr:rRNA maturation RNase YbeY [Bryobacteraceae bacterium]